MHPQKKATFTMSVSTKIFYTAVEYMWIVCMLLIFRIKQILSLYMNGVAFPRRMPAGFQRKALPSIQVQKLSMDILCHGMLLRLSLAM